MTPSLPLFRPTAWSSLLVLALAGCAGAAPTSAGDGTATGMARQAASAARAEAAAKTGEATNPEIEKHITITLPEGLDRYPVLAQAVKASADHDATLFREMAAETLAMDHPIDTWELTLAYRGLVGNRYLRVVEGEGYSYTGGAHGMPLIERFTYDGYDKRVMAIGDWFQGDAIWTVLSTYTRQALIAADGELMSLEMIESGTKPKPDNFSLYEPVFSADGPVMAFRILFPPYQVAPYAAGPQSVEVPLDVVAEHLTEHARTVLLAAAGSE